MGAAQANSNVMPPVPPSRASLWVMLCGTFMVTLDFFIVMVALPSIQRDLGASEAALQWVVGGYGVAMAAGLITGGRLGDILIRMKKLTTPQLLDVLVEQKRTGRRHECVSCRQRLHALAGIHQHPHPKARRASAGVHASRT